MLRSMAGPAVFALFALFVPAAPAQAWTFEEFLNPQGDRGTGIVQAASNEPGIELAFGCDGDRWRQVALMPEGETPLRLSTDGTVNVGFRRDRLTPDGTWKVRKTPAGILYFAPAPTQLMGRLYREESKDPEAVFYMQVRPAKKSPVLLEFPVRGLRAALAEHLWTACKLDIYFGDPK